MVLLFLCTGNYYRSRFAEEMFNSLAPAQCPDWSATSRGIAVDLGTDNIGPIALAAARALAARGLPFDRERARMPMQVTIDDLDRADHIVALKQTEHFPLMRERFPFWLTANDPSRIEYWEIHDVDRWTPDQALPLIEQCVTDLIARLAAGKQSAAQA
jgi:protein-tyrosine phosphatase